MTNHSPLRQFVFLSLFLAMVSHSHVMAAEAGTSAAPTPAETIAALEQANVALREALITARQSLAKVQDENRALREQVQVISNSLEITRQQVNEARKNSDASAK